MAKTQLGLGGGQGGQALDQGVEVQTDTWRDRERGEGLLDSGERRRDLARAVAVQIFSINHH